MWFKEFNRYFREIEYFASVEIDERSFSNPHPSGNNIWSSPNCQKEFNGIIAGQGTRVQQRWTDASTQEVIRVQSN